MITRLPHADLRAKVRDPGFTPSVRDTPGLVELLADEDRPLARDAERALARIGPAVVPRAVDLARTAAPPVRVGIARLFGRMAAEGDAAAALAWLMAALTDPDARVRRAAAHSLGKHRNRPDIEVALLDALDRERGAPEVRAMVGALGKVGSTRALERLRTLRSDDDPELRRILAQAVVMLSRGDRPQGQAIVDDKAAEGPVAILVRCREGLEDVLREEIATKGGAALRVEVRPRVPGVVHAVLTGPMRSVFALRTMTSFALELADVGMAKADVERVLVDAFTSPLARGLLQTFTQGPVRYRIAWGSGGHRRAAVWRCAQAIATRCPDWINDPTESTWEVVLNEGRGRITTELRPRALPDPRFAYRKRDVPAASHPTIAAALVHVAGVRADDVVWDPFVGSGTELVERAMAGPYAELHGSDTDPRALDVARENFAAAGLEGVHLAQADATTHVPPTQLGVTLVLTNPPMGRRVARSTELATTLDRFVDHVAEVLVPGGRFVWLSPLPERTAERARLAGLALHGTKDVDMGGFVAQMQTLVK